MASTATGADPSLGATGMSGAPFASSSGFQTKESYYSAPASRNLHQGTFIKEVNRFIKEDS